MNTSFQCVCRVTSCFLHNPHNNITPGRGQLLPHRARHCGIHMYSRSQVRRRRQGMSGEHHAGAKSTILPRGTVCSAAGQRQTVSAGCQHLLQRRYHLPEAQGSTLPPPPNQLQSCRQGPELAPR